MEKLSYNPVEGGRKGLAALGNIIRCQLKLLGINIILDLKVMAK